MDLQGTTCRREGKGFYAVRWLIKDATLRLGEVDIPWVSPVIKGEKAMDDYRSSAYISQSVTSLGAVQSFVRVQE